MKKGRLLGKLTALAAVSLVFLTACQNQGASEEDLAATDSSADQETEGASIWDYGRLSTK